MVEKSDCSLSDNQISGEYTRIVIRDVEDLRVYKQSLEVLRKVYELVGQLPRISERLVKQITASAESIPALIAEGFGKRRSPKEFKRFLEMAMGSSDETITHAKVIKILAEKFPRIPRKLCEEVEAEYRSISKQINKLVTVWSDFR